MALSLPAGASPQFRELYDDWRWVHFTTEAGLPSNHVLDLVETSDGTMWAATTAGIARYDGFQWHVALASSSPEVTSEEIRLSTDAKGNLIALLEGKLYKEVDDQLVRVDIRKDGKSISIWFACRTGDDEYICFDEKQRCYRYLSGRLDSIPVPGQLINTVAHGVQVSQYTMWLSTTQGLYEWSKSGWVQRIPVRDGRYEMQTISHNVQDVTLVSLVQPPSARGLWIFKGEEKGRYVAEEGAELIRAMDISPLSDTMIVVYKSGEVRFYQNKTWSSLEHPPQQLRSALMVRFSTKGLWIGTESGLYLAKIFSRRWSYWSHPFPSTMCSIHEIVRSRDGLIWLGTMGGIEIRDSNGTMVRQITEINGNKIPVITGLAEDNEGNIWTSSGLTFDGAYQWNGQRWKHFGEAEGLASPRIHKIRNDLNGRVWFIGLQARDGDRTPGAFLYDHGVISRWKSGPEIMTGRLYSFVQTADSALWFGGSGGVSRWKEGQWQYWRFGVNINANPFVLAAGLNNTMWLGDRNTGVTTIDPADKVHADTNLSMPSPAVWDLGLDNYGTMWIATRNGIVGCRDSTDFMITTSAGLTNTEIWPILPANDRLYIGTDGGSVCVLNFEERENPPPQVEIEPPSVDVSDVLLRWHAFSYWGEVREDNILTRYSLDGKTWSKWSPERELTLNSVPEGKHRFLVQAKGLFGKFRDTPYIKAFTIAPPLYRRASVMVPAGILVFAVIYLAAALVIRKRQHTSSLIVYRDQLRSLASQLSITEDRERRRMATYVHDSISQALAFCKIKLAALRDAQSPTDVTRAVDEVSELMSQSIESAQTLTFELSPPVLYELTFVEALEWLADVMEGKHGLRIDFSDDGAPKPLGEDVRGILFHAVKECLVNVVKHSKSRHAQISVMRLGDTIRITVKDEGVGMAREQLQTRTTTFGLFNIRERISSLGGSVIIDSKPGLGTTVSLTTPLSTQSSGQGIRI
ncbi:MAG TPA: ATP-binding protein [Bacteroidota bacterium]|nr:ATP-binding protein [Bacteroidota bacterium]